MISYERILHVTSCFMSLTFLFSAELKKIQIYLHIYIMILRDVFLTCNCDM